MKFFHNSSKYFYIIKSYFTTFEIKYLKFFFIFFDLGLLEMISGVFASNTLDLYSNKGGQNSIYGGGVVGSAHQDNRLRPGIYFLSVFGPGIPFRFNIRPYIRCLISR